MIQTTSHLATFEADIQQMRAYLAENQSERPLHEVEAEIFAQVLRLGRSMLASYVAQVGPGGTGVRHADETGTERRFHSLKPLTYRSVFGAVTIPRAYYHHPGHGGLCPLDAAFSLPERSYSLLLQKWVTMLAVKNPYDDSVDDLATLLGIALPKLSAERILADASPLVAPFRAEQPAPTGGGSVLVIEADGKGVRMVRPKSDEPPGPAMRRKKGEKRNKMKMATVFTLYTLDPQPLTAPEPQHRKVYAFLGTKRAAFEAIRAEVAKRGYGQKPTLFLSDGDPDLAELQRTFFPDAQPCVDWIHVVERLWTAAYVFHKEGSAEAAVWVKTRKERLLAGAVGTVIRGLKSRTKMKGRGSAARKKTLKEVIVYLEGVRKRVPYDVFWNAGYPIATGSVEGACCHLIVDRMERSGMRWKEAGAQAMLDLRAVHLNGEWDDFWRFRMAQEHDRLYGSASQAAA
jgi:hypothetical protein